MKNKLIWVFYLIFSLVFTFVTVNVVWNNVYYQAMWLIIIALICLAGIAGIYKLLAKNEAFLEKNYTKIIWIFLAIMFIIQFVLGLILRYDPKWDVGALQKGAAEWVETGTFKNYYDYFQAFPHNLKPTMFLYLFLKAASFAGIKDYYAVGVFINSAIICASMALASLICRKLSDAKHAVFVLALFAVSVQYWFWGGAVYTDSLSALFPVLIFWLYLKAREAAGRKKWFMYLLMGIATTLGYMIKFPVIIMTIALIIVMLFNKEYKDIIKSTVCVAVIMAIVTVSYNGFIYSVHLDKDNVYKDSRPYSHWIMMGLKGVGYYNPEDYTFTDSFSDPEEKREAINKEILNRIKKLGPSGIFELIKNKSAIDFGDGTYGISDSVGISPQNDTKLHEFVLYDGKYYKKYGTYVTAMHIAIMVLMLLASWTRVLKKRRDENESLALYISIFGLWMFLMMWEANRRYFSNFAPVIFMLGVLGIDGFRQICGKIRKDLSIRLKN